MVYLESHASGSHNRGKWLKFKTFSIIGDIRKQDNNVNFSTFNDVSGVVVVGVAVGVVVSDVVGVAIV